MKNFRYFIYIILLIFILYIPAFAIMGIKAPGPSVDSGDPSAAALATTAKKITSDKTTGEPGFMGVYDSNDTNIYGVKGPNNIATNILEIPPDTLPTNGQTKVYSTPVVRSASGNIPAHTELPFIWSTITGGGSSLIPEVLTAPNHSDLTTGQAVICRQTGQLYIKTDRGLYNTTSLNFTPIPPTLIITSPTEGAWVNPNNVEIVGTTICPTGVEDVTVQGFVSGTATTSDSFVNWSSGITTNGIDGYKTFIITATGTLSPHLTDVEELHLNCDATDPVLGTITPSVTTHSGTGTSVNITVASVTETNESNRQYSIYNVTTSAIVGSWITFTGLTINNIILPSTQNTYRIDIRCYDLAGNVGTSISSNIVYGAGSITETLRPNGGGTTTWTTYDAAAYPAHNTYLSDQSDTTYVYTSTSSTLERHDFANTTIADTISNVTMYARAYSTTPGDILRLLARSAAGTAYYSSNQTMTGSIAEYSYTWNTNPATGSAWTTTDVDAFGFGVRSESGSGQWRLADIWIVVTYE